jgi:hypothetical protein
LAFDVLGRLSATSSISFLAGDLSRNAPWWRLGGNKVEGIETVRCSRSPFDKMFGVPRVRESEIEFWTSICCKESSILCCTK